MANEEAFLQKQERSGGAIQMVMASEGRVTEPHTDKKFIVDEAYADGNDQDGEVTIGGVRTADDDQVTFTESRAGEPTADVS